MVQNEKILGSANAISGGLGIISAHNLCHNVCLGAIAFIGAFGLTVDGMPLAFLAEYNTLFWGMAAFFLVISLALHATKKACFSQKTVLFNAGIVVAGVPFGEVAPIHPLLWFAGGAMVVVAIAMFVKEKLDERAGKNEKTGKTNQTKKCEQCA
ncbi:MAG: hypothetical protein AABW86_02175 [Candidatus Micrarchaeota archaeon]